MPMPVTSPPEAHVIDTGTSNARDRREDPTYLGWRSVGKPPFRGAELPELGAIAADIPETACRIKQPAGLAATLGNDCPRATHIAASQDGRNAKTGD
jgi:hypothetical protein